MGMIKEERVDLELEESIYKWWIDVMIFQLKELNQQMLAQSFSFFFALMMGHPL